MNRTTARFEGRYHGLSQAQILTGLKQLKGLQLSRVRGLSFAADQGVSAYAATSWVEHLDEPACPNRLVFVAC